MAVEAKIVFFSLVVCIWFASFVTCQTITGRPQDYGEISKAVDRFLDILVKEDTTDPDFKLDSWETLLDEEINPKLKILAHVMRSLSSRPDIPSVREQLYIPTSYLQPFITDEDAYSNDPSSKLPSLQSSGLDQIKNKERNNYWGENDIFPENEEKRNGIWYGKRATNTDDAATKRNGIWYGKRNSPTIEDKRNGIWYGKRNGIWYGKRNGIWYGKRDSGYYPSVADEVM
uniref:NGIWYamide n=1 Tax=Holothuria leucospilota TaxID=206669 RepID=A0A2U8U7K1_HOLLE|nr:NGIWYamide precursor [Holothuria leucospilota]